MIPDEIIEQVRDAADLVDLIGENVQLKRAGSDWRGPCPFHGGTHRNFAVIPKKGLYYCYVCHAAGDVFTYLMKRFGMDYPTAVREVARRVGIVIPEGRAAPVDHRREALFGAMAVAQEWFAARLREGADADQARQYLENRDIPIPVAAEWGLGYAPRDRSFLAAMKELGIDETVLLDAGLLVKRDDGTVNPRFRGRLLFPIRDQRGRVVAFGGRILGSGEPKYLNSPESPIFHKGSTLYNLDQAKNAIRREGHTIVVEGYFDALRLVGAGIEQVVAPLGTALTDEQAKLLARFAPMVILLYDSDGPGLKATFRSGDECLRHGLRVRVATMPEGEDPDTLVRRGGAAAMKPILDDAVDVLERKIQLLERKNWFDGVERRRDALDRLLPTIRACSDPIAKDLYLMRVAERVGISRAVLEQELAAPPRQAPALPPAKPVGPARPPTSDRRPARALREGKGAPIERRFVLLMLADAGWRARAKTEIPPERLEVPGLREIYCALIGQDATLESLHAGLSERAKDALERLLKEIDYLEGANLDDIYTEALVWFDERDASRQLPPPTDIEARIDSKKRLSPAGLARLQYTDAASRAKAKPQSVTRSPDPRHEG